MCLYSFQQGSPVERCAATDAILGWVPLIHNLPLAVNEATAAQEDA